MSARGKKFLARIEKDERGGVAVIFAAAIIPTMLTMGLAIDYARVVSGKATLQAASDAVALALTRTVTPTTTAASLNGPAAAMLVGQPGPDRISLVGGVTLSDGNRRLCLTAAQKAPGLIMSMFGLGVPSVTVTTCAAVSGAGGLEVALVLDNTGSMASSAGGKSKLEAAQQAALKLVNQLAPAGQPASATISIVPFSTSVNVGTGFATAAWLDAAGRSSIHWQNHQRPAGAALPASRFELFSQMGATWAGCVEERPDPYLVTDTPANAAAPDTLFVPYLWPDEGDVNGTGAALLPGMSVGNAGNGKGGANGRTYSASNSDYGGAQNNYLFDFGGACTASATDPYEAADVADPVSRGGGATKLCKYKGASGVSSSASKNGPNFHCFGNPLLTLTQDNSALTAKINSMSAGGTTNLLPGFMWGWRTISPNGPFKDLAVAPKPYGAAGNTKAIVFMTDGFNNWTANSDYAYKSEYNALGYYVNNRLSGYGGPAHPTATGAVNFDGPTSSANWRQQMDAALLAACKNAKAAGVVVYTVGFSTPSDPIDTQGIQLLSQCASDTSRAYIAQDASGIVNVFAQIGAGLGSLRLVK